MEEEAAVEEVAAVAEVAEEVEEVEQAAEATTWGWPAARIRSTFINYFCEQRGHARPPAENDTASPAARGRLAERYLASLGVLTEGLGPTMLVKAREGSGVITTEL